MEDNTKDQQPFKRKYFDEVYFEWHHHNLAGKDHITNVNEFGLDKYTAVKEYERVREALWQAVKYDYELFRKITGY